MARRWVAHVRHAYQRKTNSPFHRAIRKYGPQAFAHEVLETVSSREAANEAEVRWIAQLQTMAPNGFNLDPGGKVAGKHPETRRRMSEAQRARHAAMSPERHREIALKIHAKFSPAQRSEIARKRTEALGPEKRSERLRKAHAAKTPEQRSEVMRKANASRTPEQRSAVARKIHAGMTREKAAARTAKIWATRKERYGPKGHRDLAGVGQLDLFDAASR